MPRKKLKRSEWMVSTTITLPQSELEKIDAECENRSKYLRDIIMNRPKKSD